jgi:NAD(P)-dependent dehydrogenase (short-subunit alcohol dehydrogenase family)
MTTCLKDKVIILAGCGGIGDGLARRYSVEGAALVLADVRGDHTQRLARELDPSGERVVGTAMDGGDDASVEAMVKLATHRFGRLDGMHVNFADVTDGLDPRGIDIPLEMFDAGMRINARGYFLCSRHAIPAMIATGGGSIVYTSSAEAYRGNGVRFAYGMAKAAILSLMRSVATRYGRDRIRANAIAPGYIGHERMSGMSEEAINFVKNRTPIKSRVGRPDDIAAIGAFLLSDDAGYITGQAFSVDGGLIMRP